MVAHVIQRVGQHAFQLQRNSRNLASNLRRLGTHALSETWHSPQSLKTSALVLSTLGLISSRIVIVNFSAAHAKADQKEHRQLEAIKSTVRELLGWTFSWFVLKAAEPHLGKGLQKFFNIQVEKGTGASNKSGQAIREMFAQVGRYLKGQRIILLTNADEATKAILKPSVQDGRPAVIISRGEPTNNITRTGANMFRWLTKRFGSAEKAHSLIPILVASIPTILLSGFWLESYSTNHSEKVAGKIHKFFGFSGSKEPTVLSNIQDSFNKVHGLPSSSVSSTMAKSPSLSPQATAFNTVPLSQSSKFSSLLPSPSQRNHSNLYLQG